MSERIRLALRVLQIVIVGGVIVGLCYGSYIVSRAIIVTALEYRPPPVDVCNAQNPTAAMILDCQATREAATIVAGDK